MTVMGIHNQSDPMQEAVVSSNAQFQRKSQHRKLYFNMDRVVVFIYTAACVDPFNCLLFVIGLYIVVIMLSWY